MRFFTEVLKFISLATTAECLAKIRINPKTLNFEEDFTKYNVIFHGQNVVVKVPPYIPSNEGFDA